MKKLAFLLVCLSASLASAQIVRKDGVLQDALGRAMSQAQVYVCTQPCTSTSVPPSPLATIYSDSAGDASLFPGYVVTDGLGNYNYYFASSGAPYTEVFVWHGTIVKVLPDQDTFGSGGGSGFSFTCGGALNGSMVATKTTASASCDPLIGTDFNGNGFSQSWATLGAFNGFYQLKGGAADPGTSATYLMPSNAMRLLAPQTTTAPYSARLPSTPCAVGQVWNVTGVTTDGNGQEVDAYGCFTPLSSFGSITAGTNTKTLTMGSGGSLSQLNIGQVAGSQMWLAPGLSAPTFSCSNSGGTILAGQNIQLAYTLNTGAGATLGSVQVTSGVLNGCSGTTISVTVNAPTQPSGYTGWTAYYCNASGSPSCTAPVQVASCINITGNCVITSSANGTTALPTINTAWLQPPNVQADPFPIHGMQPSIFETEADGNNYPVAGVDFATCAPLLSPCGVLTWTRPFFVNDTGVNIGESAPDIGIMKNNLFSVSHVMGHYTNNATGNDDRAIGIRTSTPSTMVGAFGRLLGVYEETIINGKPTSFSAAPDSGAIGIRAVIGDDRDTSSGAGLTTPMVALDGSYQFSPSAGTTWNVGTCGPCGIGVRGTAGFDTNGINGGGLGLAGVYGQVSGSASGSNVFGADFWGDVPTVTPQAGFMVLYAKSGMPTSAGNWFLRSDTAGFQSILSGALSVPSLNADASTMTVTGSIAPTGAVTTSQLATPTATAACTAGATTFTGKIVAKDSNGSPTAALTLNFNNCASDVNSSNKLIFQLANTPGASSYDFYLSNAGGGTCNGGACTLGKIGSITPTFVATATSPSVTFNYTGAAGDGTSAPTVNTTGGVSTAGDLTFTTNKGQHINTQAAGNDFAGTCTAAAATTCTVTFTRAYTSAPVCTATDATNITTLKVTPSTGSLVITTTGATSDVFDYICVGNPN